MTSTGSGPAAARTRPAVTAAARASESETRARVRLLLGGAGAARCRVAAIRFLAVWSSPGREGGVASRTSSAGRGARSRRPGPAGRRSRQLEG